MFHPLDVSGEWLGVPLPGQEASDGGDLAPAVSGLYPPGHRVQGLQCVLRPLALRQRGGELGRHHSEVFPKEWKSVSCGDEVTEDPVQVKVRPTEDTLEHFLGGAQLNLHYVLQTQQWAHMKLL